MIDLGKGQFQHRLNQEFLRRVHQNDLADASRLLKTGAQINACDVYHNTGLHYAVVQTQKGDTEMLSLLIDHGASINQPNCYDQVPLQMAVYKRRLDCAELLLREGANPNHCDALGHDPIRMARDNCHSEMVALLLKFNGDANLLELPSPDISEEKQKASATILHFNPK